MNNAKSKKKAAKRLVGEVLSWYFDPFDVETSGDLLAVAVERYLESMGNDRKSEDDDACSCCADPLATESEDDDFEDEADDIKVQIAKFADAVETNLNLLVSMEPLRALTAEMGKVFNSGKAFSW